MAGDSLKWLYEMQQTEIDLLVAVSPNRSMTYYKDRHSKFRIVCGSI